MGELTVVKSEPLPLTVVKSVPDAPQERSFADAALNAGEKFWEWTGKPFALALGMGSGTTQERAAQMRDAQKQIVQGILNEPFRMRQELTNALDALVAGNPRATLHHVLNAAPLVGEGINQAAQEFNKGDISSGVGHTAAMLLPAATKEAPAIASGAKALGGAMRDVAATVLPERTPVVPGAVSPTVVHTIGKWAAGKVIPGGGKIYDLVRDLAKGAEEAAPAAETPAAAPPVETPGMVLARESGQDWAKLSAEDRGMLETVAKANANAAAQLARPPMGPPLAPEPLPAAAVAASDTRTIAEVLRDEMAAQRRSDIPSPEPPATATPEPAAPAPAAPEPAPAPKGNAAEIAAQLEASMRAETLTDYLVRNKVPASMVADFGPDQWKMVSEQAGVQPPTEQNIAAIRDNLAQYEGANKITATTPEAAAAEFEQKRAVRKRRNPPPDEPAAQAATASPQPQPPTPGQAYAESQGYDWAQLSAEDRTALEHVAQAQANAGVQTAPAAPQTLRELMQPEKPPAPKPANIYVRNARAAKAVRVADAAAEAGLTSADVFGMKPDELALKLGEKSISADTVAMVVDKLRRREADAARASAPPPTTLRDLMKTEEPPAAAAPRKRRSKPTR